MSTQVPVVARLGAATPRPFPTRGVPGGWHDPWDTDPIDAVLATVPNRDTLWRIVREAGMQVNLMATARDDGRWEAHVVTWGPARLSRRAVNPMDDGSAVAWPSVNGPSAVVALDALEAELRERLRGGSA